MMPFIENVVTSKGIMYLLSGDLDRLETEVGIFDP